MKKCISTHGYLTTRWRLTRELQFIAERLQDIAFPTGVVHTIPSAIRFAMEDEKRRGDFVSADSARGRAIDGEFSQNSFRQSVYLRYFHMESLSARVAHERSDPEMFH